MGGKCNHLYSKAEFPQKKQDVCGVLREYKEDSGERRPNSGPTRGGPRQKTKNGHKSPNGKRRARFPEPFKNEKEEQFMKRKTFSSRLLAILMTVALVLSFASVSAFATETHTEGNLTLTKYESGDWQELKVDTNDQGVPEGWYAAVEIQQGDAVYLNQSKDFYLLFGATLDQLASCEETLKDWDGNFPGTESFTHQSEIKTNGKVQYWISDDKKGQYAAQYYYGYQQDGKTYILASSNPVATAENSDFSVKISIPLENTGVYSVFATSFWPFSLIFSLARRNEGNFFQAVPTTLSSSLAEVRLASLVAWA